MRKVMEDYVRLRHLEAGYELSTPAHQQGRTVRHLRHLGFYADLMYPRCTSTRSGTLTAPEAAGAGLLPEADELPDALPDLPVLWTVVPRAAAAALRVRQRLPVRVSGWCTGSPESAA